MERWVKYGRFGKKSWGKRNLRSPVSDERKKAWKKAIGEGRTPSDFIKAIYGMKLDPWPERKDRNGWVYVVRHIERWIDLFDEHGLSTSLETKIIKGVLVPKSYMWTQEDEHLLQMGKRFDVETEKWI